jgi:hypothetical protein
MCLCVNVCVYVFVSVYVCMSVLGMWLYVWLSECVILYMSMFQLVILKLL